MGDNVLGEVRQFILTNFLFGEASKMPGDSDSLLASGVLDSTGVLELVEFVEGDLSVPVADHETVPANFDSMDNIASFVLRKRATTAV
ncbi:acyl carrier protein [Janibacter sp. YB324]|uniref:acyl carrier protein n=1 Tax=Janibacter sp. YB324 TaxID=2761047 RepID=UPI0016284D2B|nr:acyl carrier protein [Janibacter sp. YB324]QNF93478.1 acyl carrier protein [Janibacter sp. YB324]